MKGQQVGLELYSFPVKHNWWENADFDLIEQSTIELKSIADRKKYDTIVLPRPGCGNGGLDWEDVKPILETHFDNRFYVITWEDGI
jgi:O-acetyl-ADP-ribose deacetylase (regulator of RNase III)